MRPRSRASSAIRPARFSTVSSSARATVPSSSSPMLEPAGSEVAGPVPPGGIGDAAHPMAEPARHHEGHHHGSGERQSQCGQRRPQDRLQLVADIGQRQRQADEGNLRMVDPRRDVQHVDVQRRAVARGAPDPVPGRGFDLRPGEVIFQGRQGLHRLRRIAEHASARIDERDTRGDELAHPIRFSVQVIDRRGGAQELRGEPGFFDEGFLEARVGLPPHRLGHQQACDEQRDQR